MTYNQEYLTILTILIISTIFTIIIIILSNITGNNLPSSENLTIYECWI